MPFVIFLFALASAGFYAQQVYATTPAVPTGLSAIVGYNQVTQITLSWTAAAATTPEVASYEYSQDNGSTWTAVPNSDGTTIKHTVTGLTLGTTYTFKVRAIGSRAGAASDGIAVTLFGLQANVKYNQVNLHWTQSDLLNVAGYEYRKDNNSWTAIPNSDSTTTAHTVTDITPGTPHTFTIRALNSVGTVLAESNNVIFIPGRVMHGSNGLSLSDLDYFGTSLGLSPDGNTLFVGTFGEGTSEGSNRGAVHVFTKDSENIWIHSTTITHGTNGLTLAKDSSFGSSVTVSPNGNTLFVGAPGDKGGGHERGAVYIFTKSGNTWTHSTKIAHGTNGLTLTDDSIFGGSLETSSDGNTLFVGAERDNTSGSKRGAVHIFTKSGDTWTHSTKIAHGTNGLTLADADRFGSAIKISPDDNILYVGAVLDDTGGTNKGAVHIFTKSENTWTHSTKIAHGTSGLALVDHDYFGSSLELSPNGNTLFVGTYRGDDYARVSAEPWYEGVDRANKGAVHIFTKKESVWTYRTKLGNNVGNLVLDNLDNFGSSIVISPNGNTLYVGAMSDDTTGGLNRGSVHVLTKGDDTWAHSTKLEHGTKALTLNDDTYFGDSIVISSDGNTLFVGARHENTGDLFRSGAVYIFVKDAGAWVYDKKITHGTNGLTLAAYTYFGFSLFLSEDDSTLYVGSPGYNPEGFILGTGAVHVFTKNDSNEWAHNRKITHSTNGLTLSSGDYFGTSLVISSDENTLYVGAFRDSSGVDRGGSVHIFTKNSSGKWVHDGKIGHGINELTLSPLDFFGYSLAVSQDESMLYVGAIRDGGAGVSKAGAVYIFMKENDMWVPETRITHGTHGLALLKGDFFGSSLEISENGDTLYVGAYNDDTGGTNKGAVHIFTRDEEDAWMHSGKIKDGVNGLSLPRFASLGTALAFSEDESMLYAYIGARRDRGGYDGFTRGAVYIFTKNSENEWIFHKKITHGTVGIYLADNDYFGSSAVLSPDGNTLYVGAAGADTIGPDKGTVHMFRRSDDGVSWVYIAKIGDGTHGLSIFQRSAFGKSIALSQDNRVLLVGAPNLEDRWYGNGYNVGAAYILVRGNDGEWTYNRMIANRTSGLTLDTTDHFGSSVAVSSDGNTFFIGAIGDDTGGTDRGAVHIFTKRGKFWLYKTTLAHSSEFTLADGDYFGSSLTLSRDGNTLYVGADHADTGGADRGAVHIFTKGDNNTWTHSTTIAHNTHGLVLADNDYFGSALTPSSDGNTLFIGARRHDSDGTDRGAVHAFTKNEEGTWAHRMTMTHDTNGLDLANGDNFGNAVVLSPDENTLYVGAHRDDYGDEAGSGTDRGAIHTFTLVDSVFWSYSH